MHADSDEYLVLAQLMKQFAEVVQAAGDGALVGMRVLQVLIWDISTSVKGALGLFNLPLGDQDDAHVQVCSCERGQKREVIKKRLNYPKLHIIVQMKAPKRTFIPVTDSLEVQNGETEELNSQARVGLLPMASL